ncbi:MAG: phospholipid carrier-dependent glycosyltransferase [Isosphaeraceae bacterium]
MAEPHPPESSPAQGGGSSRLGRLASLAVVLELALALRVVAADAVEWLVRRGGTPRLDVFPDTGIYWELARAIRAGGPYEYVEWADIPHFAIRTPGYPLLLAACQAAFGERTLPVRLVQAGLGALCVYLVYRLAAQFVPGPAGSSRGRWSIPLVAAAFAAVSPHYLFLSAVVLSEAAFEPLMLAMLLGLAVLWKSGPIEHGTERGSGWRMAAIAIGTGLSAGAAVLVRPSWLLFIPAMLGAWLLAAWRRRDVRAAARGSVLVVLGAVAVMAPWWVRNARVYGRFVPTALWMGASLYDGLNPGADGSSEMLPFLRDPEIWPLDEQDQDAELTGRAIAFARANPARVLELAAIKLGRYWSPWPNAEGFRSWPIAVASALVELPILALVAVGLWVRRGEARAWVILAGPLLYFCALHAVFASSMRYRIPAEMPALALAGIGWARMPVERNRT